MRPMLLVAVLVVLAGADRCAPELAPGCPWTPEEVGQGCRCVPSAACTPGVGPDASVPGVLASACREGFIRFCRRSNVPGDLVVKGMEPPAEQPQESEGYAPRVRRP